jgi:hypothetical protein
MDSELSTTQLGQGQRITLRDKISAADWPGPGFILPHSLRPVSVILKKKLTQIGDLLEETPNPCYCLEAAGRQK